MGALTSYIHKFKYYGTNAYPHVFIPFIDEVDQNQRPIIAINYNDDEILEGFELVTNTDGTETLNEINIDETMARNRPVWVVAVNERVDDSGSAEPFNGVSGNGCPPGYHPAPYQAPPSCSNGIQDGDETGIDCGGICPFCPTCEDGVQNGDEEYIDCGGSECAPCVAICDNGVWDSGEEGIDCGGLCPDVCESVSLRFTTLFISDKKEAWGNGRAGIFFRAVHYYANNSCDDNVVVPIDEAHAFGLSPFLRISNSELNTWQPTYDVAGSYIAGYGLDIRYDWNPSYYEKIGLVLYEADRRGSFEKDYYPNSNLCSTLKVIYTSKESAYGTIDFDGFIEWPATNVTQNKQVDLNGSSVRINYELD